MRPRSTKNHHLPPRMYQKNRTRKNGDVWTTYVYRGTDGVDIQLGKDLDKARLKWAELEAKDKPADLTTMRSIFDRYARDIIPTKAPRTQQDNIKELKQLRVAFDTAPIDAITPAMIAGYRDRRSAKTRANRELALFSHVFNTAREWGLTRLENPCKGVKKNKEIPRDFYATDEVWDAVYACASHKLSEAMDLAYLTGQRPADVHAMGRINIEGVYLMLQQGKTNKKLRILLEVGGVRNTLGLLVDRLMAKGHSGYFITSARGTKVSSRTLHLWWDTARQKAIKEAIEAGRPDLAENIAKFQFRDIRPKAASEIIDIGDASRLLGHSKEGITERVYRRVGAIANPTK